MSTVLKIVYCILKFKKALLNYTLSQLRDHVNQLIEVQGAYAHCGAWIYTADDCAIVGSVNPCGTMCIFTLNFDQVVDTITKLWESVIQENFFELDNTIHEKSANGEIGVHLSSWHNEILVYVPIHELAH